MIDIIIGIQNMGSDTGPTFDLYSDLDGYQAPFEINVSKVDLLVGYTTTAPTGSTIIRVKSKGECETYIDIPILEPTTTTTTTLPPETTTTTTTTTSTTTTTTSTTTLPPDTTTTTTVLNKELIITNVEWDLSEGMYLVYFTSNFALTQLAIQTSSNGINWSAPELFNDLSTPQLFIPVPHFNTFYVRLFDSNLGDITYSNVYQYFEPLTSTTTTTTLPTINYQLTMSGGVDSPSSVNCNTFMSNVGGRYTIETLPVLSDYPQAGKTIYNSNGTPFNGGNKYYRIQFSLISTIGESIIARVASNGDIYAPQQICSGSTPILE